MKKNLKKFLSLIVVLSLINLYAIAPQAATASTPGEASSSEFSANSSSEGIDTASFTFGVDADGVPFAANRDGAKAKYLSISPKQYKIQVFKGSYLGEAVFRKNSDREVVASFKAYNKESLTAQTTFPPVDSQLQKLSVNLSLQYTKSGQSLKASLNLGGRNDGQLREEELRKIIDEVRASESLKTLMATSRIFSRIEVVKLAFALTPVKAASGSCFWSATSCVASLIEYGLAIALIAELCGATLGLGCFLALAYHPIGGLMVAKHCSDAISDCGLDSSGGGGGGGGPTKREILP